MTALTVKRVRDEVAFIWNTPDPEIQWEMRANLYLAVLQYIVWSDSLDAWELAFEALCAEKPVARSQAA